MQKTDEKYIIRKEKGFEGRKNIYETAGEIISSLNHDQLYNLDVNNLLAQLDKNTSYSKTPYQAGAGQTISGTAQNGTLKNTGFEKQQGGFTRGDYSVNTNNALPVTSIFGKNTGYGDTAYRFNSPEVTPENTVNKSIFGERRPEGTFSIADKVTPTVFRRTQDGWANKPVQLASASKENWLDTLSGVLAGASLIPGLDTFTNLASIPVDLAQGDYLSAVLDAFGAIPIVGEIADTAKLGIKGGKVIDRATDAVRAVNASTKKTLILPKKEYAHVMSEISTHITEWERGQPVISRAIGNYIYTFENQGNNMYRIIGKKLIE